MFVGVINKRKKIIFRTRGGDIQKRNFYVQTDISGEHCFKMVILEMALTHLFVSLTFKKIQVNFFSKAFLVSIFCEFFLLLFFLRNAFINL